MGIALEDESTLTDRYQTTVPETVRRVLRLTKRDKIRYTVRPDGDVVISRVEAEDPALGPFLKLLAQDIEQHPERLVPITEEWAAQLDSLVEGIDVDLDGPPPADDE